MRLSVFVADTLSTQLTIDLQKIYLNERPEASLTAQALSDELQKKSSLLYVTMFNDRHIGAVKVSKKGGQAILSELCIRDITRRRGIGKNLLRQVEKELFADGINSIEYDFTEVQQQQSLSTQAFLSDSGYSLNGHIATKQI